MDDKNLNALGEAFENEAMDLLREIGLLDAIMAGILFVGVGGASAIMYIKHILKNNKEEF